MHPSVLDDAPYAANRQECASSSLHHCAHGCIMLAGALNQGLFSRLAMHEIEQIFARVGHNPYIWFVLQVHAVDLPSVETGKAGDIQMSPSTDYPDPKARGTNGLNRADRL